MAAIKPTYILAPNWDFLPNGPITLGSLIMEPRQPARSLNKNARIPIAPKEITTSNKTGWSITREQLLSGKLGIWASFLALVLGVGADLAFNCNRDSNEVYKCVKLETQYFQPDEKYIKQTLLQPIVKAYVEKFPQKAVYMITGVKIVHGGTVETTNGEGFGAEVKVGVDGTPSGVPVRGGPEVKGERKKKITVKFGGSDDFVLGYQLIKIKVKKDGSFSEKDFNKWALLNDDAGPNTGQIVNFSELRAPGEEMSGMALISDVEDDDCNIIAPIITEQ